MNQMTDLDLVLEPQPEPVSIVEAPSANALPDHPTNPMVRVLAEDAARPGYLFSYTEKNFLADELLNPEISQRVWSRWYGSRKAADKVEALLRASKGADQAKALKKMKHYEPLLVLSAIFGGLHLRTLIYEGMSESVVASLCPTKHVVPVALAVIEKYGVKDFSPYNPDAADVESSWPFMKRIFDMNGFRFDMCSRLRIAGQLKRIAESDTVNAIDLPFLRVVTAMCLNGLPHRIEALAAITSPFAASCYNTKFKFAGITHASFDASRCFWDQVPYGDLVDTIATLVGPKSFRRDNVDLFMVKHEQIAAQMVSSNNVLRMIDGHYLEYCESADVQGNYADIRRVVKQSLEGIDGLPPINEEKEFPADLIGRPVDFAYTTPINEKFFELGHLKYVNDACAVGLQEAMAKDQVRIEQIEAIQAQIKDIVTSNNLADMKKMAALANQAAALVDGGREWFLTEYLPAAKNYVENWMRFYSRIDEVNRLEEEEAKKRQPAPAVHEPAPEQPAATGEPDPHHAEMSELLYLSQVENEQLRNEMAELRASLHRMRCQLASKEDTQEEFVPMDCMKSIERLVSREGFGPEDILNYYAGTAPDRLVILPKAMAGAKEYPIPYEPSERMLELVGKLVGGYLDALRSGQPDAVARGILGGKAYAAKESDSTMSTARLRAMREFVYKGEKRIFEQHLKVSNEQGARGMRIYFGVDGEGDDKKIVIAYVGPHLDVIRSN